MATESQRANTGKWGDLDLELALWGGVLKQACRDAVQTANPALSREAWDFLEICAPDVADKLRKHAQSKGVANGSLA